MAMVLVILFFLLALCALGFGMTAVLLWKNRHTRWMRTVSGVCAAGTALILLIFAQMHRVSSGW